ncbi:LnmK family bifunctional acyltransferase/decarboxylase [Prosthecobacter sp.]|uniref:LnmK family bifunctional acyltransferase/decarboxylase n=1 Tax=Prosthecobacter sp. TaxID=1965333 RepID=UPI002487EA42|nr:LnmK family bifunctional acyltransferase/decarboxylase [Prosthecobacter sp.]MDI1312633.1 phosphopantetheine-binding protein [Prosthecobacter sp.]
MIEEKLRQLFTQVVKLPEARIKSGAHVMDDLGADSLQFLDYIHRVEKDFGITLKGSDSDHFATLKKAAAFLEKRLPKTPEVAAAPAVAVSQAAPATRQSMWLDEQGFLHYPTEIGMPMTGRNNLGETPLLKLIGDLRWQHISMFSGVPSRLLADDTGERLYATFFYVEVNFSEATPMAAFGENDQIHIVSSLKSSGGSVLDGNHWLLRGPITAPPKDPSQCGAPHFRTSNIFVKMLQGAQWLKKSKPCQPGMELIPDMGASPDSADLCREADQNNAFEAQPAGWLLLTPKPVEVYYDIVPDRDLNGAGLLYFANYPQILDIVERQVLEQHLPVPFEPGLVDQRTVIKRQTAYLSNASQTDRLRLQVTVAVEDPATPQEPIRLWLNYVMWRCSDDRKMMVSTTRKLVTGMTWGDTPMLERLKDWKKR